MDEATASAMKSGARQVWSSGDYPSIAERIQEVADALVERTDPGPGQRVLDIATGSGNVAIRAAERGAEVVGTDLTPELLEAGKTRAAQTGVEIEWSEADAEDLPFADGGFEFVLSTFGIMFAPRQEVAAAEAFRVCGAGGTLGLCNWTPDGRIGRFFQFVGERMPPPPPGFVPPMAWGSEDRVRELFRDRPVDWEFEERSVIQAFGSLDDMIETYTRDLGPLVMARQVLEPEGKWEGFLEEYRSFIEAETQPVDGGVGFEGQYLMAIGRKRG